MYNKSLGQEYF